MAEAAGRTIEASRETDRRVAETLFGWDVEYLPEEPHWKWTVNTPEDWHYLAASSEEQAWGYVEHYSTDIEAAWLIVEHFLARRRNVFLTADCGWQSRPMTPHFAVEIEWMTWEPDAIEHSHASAVTMPLAICRAALLACGVERPAADTRAVTKQ